MDAYDLIGSYTKTIMLTLDPDVDSKSFELTRKLVLNGTPVYLLRRKGYRAMDFLIEGADIVFEVIYDGDMDSPEYAEAQKKLDERIRENHDVDELPIF